MSDALLRLYVTAKTFAVPADDERGASLVEYALLVALIAVVAIIAVTTLGEGVRDTFEGIDIPGAGGG